MNTDQELFAGLQALSDSAFPKHCRVCGRRYDSPADFVRHSQAPPGHPSGFRSSRDDDDRPILELYRNCECGSTLMDAFGDRRDDSEHGRHRRRLFGQLMDLLVSHGLARDTARRELLLFMRGETSAELEALGLRVNDLDYRDPLEKDGS